MALKQGIIADYRQALKDNADIAPAVEALVSVLDSGLTPMQTEDKLYDFDLTNLQTGLIADFLTKYHERGTEFRTYWNKRNNVDLTKGLLDEETTIGFIVVKRKNA